MIISYSPIRKLFLTTKSLVKNEGLSLIEIMVSLTILVVAFISLVQSFPMASTINKTAENATKASYLAQAEIERLYSLGYDHIATGTIETKQRLSNDPNNYLYYFQRQTIVNNVDINLQTVANDSELKKISVSVYYTNSLSKTEKAYDTSTLISRW